MPKISQDEFRQLKNEIKFIEHYWAEYKLVNKHYQKYQDANHIRRFIKGDKYEELIQVKYNRLSRQYSLSQHHYRDLIAYGKIARHLKAELTRLQHRRRSH